MDWLVDSLVGWLVDVHSVVLVIVLLVENKKKKKKK
jgi:hypothetical protein